MNLSEVRKRYIEYMKLKDHMHIKSSSLLPEGDETTLFTGSGMQPLLPYLLGKDHDLGKRLANSQKCFRANDIEEVGDNRHTTFFEMLGNWSLGDYFKKEQIQFCFEFLTNKEIGLGLDPNRLYVTVFSGDENFNIEEDDVSIKEWQKLFGDMGISNGVARIITNENGDKVGMKEGERIFLYDSNKNWWSRSGEPENMPVGEPGGSDTEVFYDFGEEHTSKEYAHLQPHPNSDSGRFIEICNSVFMEYIRTEEGFSPLKKKNVDFGAGLERLVAVTENTPDIFEISIFQPFISALEKESGIKYSENKKAFRVIADHIRSAMFIIADGVEPSNTSRGYVLRRLIRGALYNLHYNLEIKEASMSSFVKFFIDEYSDYYGEVKDKDIFSVIDTEEKKFLKTIKKGVAVFEKLSSAGSLSGEDMFMLQSTYGFPKELTLSLAEERNISASLEEYEKALLEHKESSRKSSKKKFKL